jgi:rod shape-determining protein MreC
LQRRTFVLLIVICLGQVLLISAQVQSRSGLPVLESVAFGTFARVQQLTAGFADGASGLWTNYFALRGAARENQQLRGRILDLEGQLQGQQAMASQTRALEALLGMRQTLTIPSLAARVIAGNPSPGGFTVTIDKGSEDGVEVNMPVIGATGVVGRIIAPLSQRAAIVQLLVDRTAGAAVTFERTGAGAMVVGGASTAPPLRAEYVPDSKDVQVGERVMTSGQDLIFPAGYLVGTVARVRRVGAEREIAIEPAVDFSHIDVVLVLLYRPVKPPRGPS